MKKVFFIAAVAAIALTSCQQEKNIGGGTAVENGISFAIQGAGTRSAESAALVKTGESILVGTHEGFNLYMEETVVDLNALGAETRGTPVYTENVGYLYRDKLGVFAESAGGVDATYSHLDENKNASGVTTGWIYQHRYSENIWPDENTPVQFYLRMPTDMTSHGVSLSNSEGVTTVSFTTPAMAKDQEDIIFSGVNMDHKTYLGYYSSQGGAPVTLYHALTGIKFAIANDAAELADIQIHKISFTGLKDAGAFTFNAANPSRTAFTWTSKTVTADKVIYQTYEDGDLVTYKETTHAGNHFAGEFFEGGTSQNLNKADASYTFWLIPQEIDNTSTAVMKIEYTMYGSDETMEIALKDLKASNWQAGQLRTYTFKLNEVNLKIEDKVAMASGISTADNGYKGAVKNNVKITNTGNTRAFIRASIVGQWLDENDDPVFGFTDAVNELHLVASWYEDQFVTKEGASKPKRDHGDFVGLAGYDMPNPNNGWMWCEDGYYYYTLAVEPDAITTALFTSYTVGNIPNAEIAGANIPNSSMYFTLEVSTQAIAANKLDGTADTWDNAWERALGAKPVKKQ